MIDKASLIQIPSGYKNGKLYSLKPSNANGDFDFSRSSSGTRVNSEGLIETAQIVSETELVTNGDFSTDSDWTKDSNWTIANGKATSTGGGRMFQSIPFLETNIGTKVKVSFDIVDYTSNGVQVNCYGGVSSVYSGVGSYSFITTTTNNTNLYFNNAGQGNLIGSIDNVSVKEVFENDVPRLDYSDGSCASLLLEPQSTNTVTYSEDFSQWHQTSSPTLTSGQLAPDGTLGATKISGTIGSSNIVLSTTSSTTATRSIYARTVSGTGTARLMSYYGNTNNLFTLTEEWQRFELTGSSSAGGAHFYIDFRDSSQTLSEFIIWGAQSEELSYPTSYIPSNSGSSTTRTADFCNNAGTSATFNSTEGVLFAEIAALANDSTYRLISIESTSDAANNFIYLGYNNSSNTVRTRMEVAGSAVTDMQFILSDETQFNKCAVKWKQNDFALWVNGVEVATDSSGSTFSSNTLNRLSFNRNSTLEFEGKCKQLMVFDEALSDSELTTLTS